MQSGGRLQSERVNRNVSQVSTQYRKMDILFYDTVLAMKQHHNFVALYHFIKALIFVIFIPINYAASQSNIDKFILAALIIALVTSLLQSLALLIYRIKVLRDIKLLLRVCQDMNHSVDQRITGDISKLQKCVSQTMYNSQNQTLITNEGLTLELRKLYKNVLQSTLKQKLAVQTPALACFTNLTTFLGFASMVYAIVALGIGKQNKAELIILIIYIILEGFSKAVIILALLLIALLPIICFVGCCIICCCVKMEEEVQLPQKQKATQEMITQAGGTCSICFQNFTLDEQVILLRCSPKHMFHPMCIGGWTKLKNSCPICRANVNDGQQRSI